MGRAKLASQVMGIEQKSPQTCDQGMMKLSQAFVQWVGIQQTILEVEC
jgi:hypothetical protein